MYRQWLISFFRQSYMLPKNILLQLFSRCSVAVLINPEKIKTGLADADDLRVSDQLTKLFDVERVISPFVFIFEGTCQMFWVMPDGREYILMLMREVYSRPRSLCRRPDRYGPDVIFLHAPQDFTDIFTIGREMQVAMRIYQFRFHRSTPRSLEKTVPIHTATPEEVTHATSIGES